MSAAAKRQSGSLLHVFYGLREGPRWCGASNQRLYGSQHLLTSAVQDVGIQAGGGELRQGLDVDLGVPYFTGVL